MSRVAALAGVLLLAACPRLDTEREAFSCAADADCGPGWRCLSGVCRAASVAGGCAEDCAAKHASCCDGACVNVDEDVAHCGACGHRCIPSERCRVGSCVASDERGRCGNGRDDDGDGDADCADEADCPAGTGCGAGTCCGGQCRRETACGDGHDDDCDGAIDCADSDCDGRSCPAGLCSGGSCLAVCLVGDRQLAAGESLPALPCFSCQPRVDPRTLTPRPQGVRTTGCNGTSACNGAGGCRAEGGTRCVAASDCAWGACTAGHCD